VSALAIVAEPAAAGIAGLDGSFEWGDAATGADPPAADVRVALGVASPGDRDPDVILAGDIPVQGAGRLIATTGDGLWSRAPWPVRDELFDLPAPDPRAGLLVVTPYPDRDAPLLEKLAERGIPVTSQAELTADALAAAAIVAYPPSPDPTEERYVPSQRQEALPATAFAPLAAGRLLIAPRAAITFGLLPGTDHLAASTDDDVVQYADTRHAFPDAFASQLAFGRIAAEWQRASLVYGRLVAELGDRGSS
jgi:hypothetical protein